MLDPSAAIRISVCPCRVSSATRSSSNFARSSSRMVSNNLRARASLCPAVSAACDAVSMACCATFRVASAAAATRPTSEAAVDAMFAANCACRCAMVSPKGDTDRDHREPAPDGDDDRVRHAANAVFGATV